MISTRKLKELVKKNTKKSIGIKAVKKIDFITEKYLEKIINKASRNAAFSGRKTIKEEDIRI